MKVISHSSRIWDWMNSTGLCRVQTRMPDNPAPLVRRTFSGLSALSVSAWASAIICINRQTLGPAVPPCASVILTPMSYDEAVRGAVTVIIIFPIPKILILIFAWNIRNRHLPRPTFYPCTIAAKTASCPESRGYIHPDAIRGFLYASMQHPDGGSPASITFPWR